MKYSEQANEIIGRLPNFDRADFEAWFAKREMAIGGNNVFQYLAELDRWNTKCVLRSLDKYSISVSGQAQLIIDNIKGIDLDDLKRWFANSAAVAPDHVFMYLDFKSKEVK